MTSSTPKLIGLAELQPEPCDGTGDDAMSIRFRRKWQRGQDTTSSTDRTAGHLIGLEERQPEPCDGTGDDVMSIRFRGKWQSQGIQPARPRRKLLNPAMLASIISSEAQKRLERTSPATKVAEIYMLNKQFHRMMLRKMEAYDSVCIDRDVVRLRASHDESHPRLDLDKALFFAMRKHKQLVFPEVSLVEVTPELHDLQMTGIERLNLWHLRGRTAIREDLALIIDANKDSLKVLKTWMPLFDILPAGLKLEEFWIDCDPEKLEVPCSLDTRVFKCEYLCFRTKVDVPPEFVRTDNAEEIHRRVKSIFPNEQERHWGVPTPALTNSRVKKLVFDIDSVDLNDFYLDRIVRDVFARCPALECFEVECNRACCLNHVSYPTEMIEYEGVDRIIGRFESEVEKCRALFVIRLNAFFQYTAESRTDVSDFARLHLNVDLPPACSDHGGWEHYHLVKETCFGKKILRMHFNVSVEPENLYGNWR